MLKRSKLKSIKDLIIILRPTITYVCAKAVGAGVHAQNAVSFSYNNGTVARHLIRCMWNDGYESEWKIKFEWIVLPCNSIV